MEQTVLTIDSPHYNSQSSNNNDNDKEGPPMALIFNPYASGSRLGKAIAL
jgi:hypothetical protein